MHRRQGWALVALSVFLAAMVSGGAWGQSREKEPNDDPTSANPVMSGEKICGTLEPRALPFLKKRRNRPTDILPPDHRPIPTPFDIDFFRIECQSETGAVKLTADTDAQTLTPPSEVNTALAVFDAEGNLVGFNDNEDEKTLDSHLEVLVRPGTYFVAVTDVRPVILPLEESGAPVRFGGEYCLTVTCAPAPPCEDKNEPNDIPRQATPVTPASTPIQAAFQSSGDEDWYRLSLTKVSPVVIELKMTGGLFFPHLIVFDEHGNVVAESFPVFIEPPIPRPAPEPPVFEEEEEPSRDQPIGELPTIPPDKIPPGFFPPNIVRVEVLLPKGDSFILARETSRRTTGALPCYELSVTIRDKFTIQGFVVDERGLPVVGATILVRGKGGKVKLSTKSSADGTFKVEGLPRGAYTLHTQKKGFIRRVAAVIVPPDQFVFITLRRRLRFPRP